MPAPTRWLLLGLVSVTLAAAGCSPDGPKLTPVTGMVRVNGKPAAAAVVFLHRKGKTDLTEPTAYATVAEDGTFKVLWQPGKEGAVPGDYVVTVVWPDMGKAADGGGGRPDLLRGTYDKVAASTLTATVTAAPTALPPFELKLSAATAARPAAKDAIK